MTLPGLQLPTRTVVNAEYSNDGRSTFKAMTEHSTTDRDRYPQFAELRLEEGEFIIYDRQNQRGWIQSNCTQPVRR